MDCYGIPRGEHGEACYKGGDRPESKYCSNIWHPFLSDHLEAIVRATDALAWEEFLDHNAVFEYTVPGFKAPANETLPDGSPVPRSRFLTSPNMYELPDIASDGREVYIRKNGRFYYQDFS